MRFTADLHIHSKYSRATSNNMSSESIWKWAQLKGIAVVGTGDFTHPQWLGELKEKLEPLDNKMFILKEKYCTEDVPVSCRSEVFFMLTTEISCIYKKYGRTRKVHSLVIAPDFATASRINAVLSKIGNLSSDGRPILGLDTRNLLKLILDISTDAMLVPAHAWTPHFSVFGASSGFDSLEECFDELAPNIYAIETGLSSDPRMNWRLSCLDKIRLISNSDAHSPAKLGREANIFDTSNPSSPTFDKRGQGAVTEEISYNFITNAIKTGRGFLGTIEFFPEEGKYHFDGHRACGVSFSPKETIEHDYLCPVCGKKVTVGVLHRVEKLADRENGFKPSGAHDFCSLIPLPEIISEAVKSGVNSKTVNNEYLRLLEKLGNEFKILMDTPLYDIEKAGSPLLREAVARMRSGNVQITPGFDGEYGKISIFEKGERKELKGQKMLF